MKLDDHFLQLFQIECDRNKLIYGDIIQENYCQRLEVSGLGESKPVHVLVYFGKKGLRPIIRGSSNSKLKNLIESLSNEIMRKIELDHAASGAVSLQAKKEQKIHTFKVLHRDKRDLIRYFIKGKYEPEEKSEQFCEYRFDIMVDGTKFILKQYNSGKLVLLGPSGKTYKEIYRELLELISESHKDGQPSKTDFDKSEKKPRIALPHIGTDESGKGDYFGPLVCAGVWVDYELVKELKTIGVRDSKKLSDNRNAKLANEIKAVCQGKYSIVEIPPDKYNYLFSQMKREGKNINVLLAWGHAKALENILATNPCNNAVADKFGNEKYIISKLQEKGRDLNLIQMPHAEVNIAVAAASILARERFLTKLKKLSEQYEMSFPKGASWRNIEVARQFVAKYGEENLNKVAKLHFKTTESVLGKDRK